MNILRQIIAKLKGTPPDPTADWPRVSPSTPTVDCTTETVGALRFGDDLAVAQAFGRPDSFRWTLPDYCELLYAKSGFLIDFDSGKFAYAAFFIQPDKFTPTLPFLVLSSPYIDATLLSRKTTQKQIESIFGEPQSRDQDNDETVLFYSRGKLTLEFEITASDLLKRVNVYPTNPT